MANGQITAIKHDPSSLPEAHRAVPGGASSVLIDHPGVIDVVKELVGPPGNVRIEAIFSDHRARGDVGAVSPLHGGEPSRGQH